MASPNAVGPASGHVRIHNQCGACGQLFKHREHGIISSTQLPPSVSALNKVFFCLKVDVNQ